jgi:hypothetical protein
LDLELCLKHPIKAVGARHPQLEIGVLLQLKLVGKVELPRDESLEEIMKIE